MIEHIVLFRCKPGTTDTIREQFVAAARSLKGEIPGILYLSAGTNWSDRSDGYELALVERFADKKALDAYQIHPYHEKFKSEWVKPHIEKVLAVDYFIA
ncbi:MAG: Dabb family protein [Chitinophagaceae bacterium]|nr:Dabb family protein [Oligoflexus sp.]